MRRARPPVAEQTEAAVAALRLAAVSPELDTTAALNAL
jgi:hypothetical protein